MRVSALREQRPIRSGQPAETAIAGLSDDTDAMSQQR
jgi:hypothetical protein